MERLPDGRFVPNAYPRFDLLPIGGVWRPGASRTRLRDLNPYDGRLLLEIPQADREDLDTAYTHAAKAQKSWARRLPAERAAVMLRAAEVMNLRREEIVAWLIQESGSTRIKAALEWEWAASDASTAPGRSTPSLPTNG